jgi:GNAT superfamily N-acetyltransferase
LLNIEIKSYNPKNLEEICKVHNEAFSEWIESLGLLYGYHRISAEDVINWIKPENSDLLLAYEDDYPIGYAHFQIEERKDKNKIVKQGLLVETIEGRGQSKIGVIPNKRGNGFATELLKHIVKIAEESNLDVIIVYSYNNNNHPMTHILQKFGFLHEPIYIFPPYSKNKPFVHDCILAEYDLSNEIDIKDKIILEDLLIREYNPDDFSDIQQILSECRPDMVEFTGEKNIGEFWLEQNWATKILVADFHGEVIGSMEYNKKGLIGIPGVKKQHQGIGVGTTLLYNLLLDMKSKGYSKALADSGIIYTNAIKLYQKLNFNTSKELWGWIYIV